MKVLEVTFVPPDTMSGGGRGILQSIRSLVANCQIDYVGPDFDMEILNKNERMRINKKIVLEAKPRNLFSLFRASLNGATTSFFDSWLNIEKQLDWQSYDCVHIESSRYDFVVKEAKKYRKPVLIRLHNIEKDYGYNEYIRNRSIGNYLRYKSYEFNESRCVKKADYLIYITGKDETRAEQLYGKIAGMHDINPVCMDENMIDITTYRSSNPNFIFLITGSLSFGPNSDGIKWFIEKVWKSSSFNKGTKLIIAGSNPSPELKALISVCQEIELVDTPKDMAPYLLRANAYIVPIFDGAGMKVKVAEALSYGLPVIGTNHAWIGYEQIHVGKYVADTPEQFIQAMIGVSKIQTDNIQIRDEFNKNYSMNASKDNYKKILDLLES